MYPASGEPTTITLLTSEYSDQISSNIVNHLIEQFNLKFVVPDPPQVTPSASESKGNDRHEVESEGKYELHVSNISPNATESDLKPLF